MTATLSSAVLCSEDFYGRDAMNIRASGHAVLFRLLVVVIIAKWPGKFAYNVDFRWGVFCNFVFCFCLLKEYCNHRLALNRQLFGGVVLSKFNASS